MKKKSLLGILAVLIVFLALGTNASSTSEEDLAFLRNYAVQNYGLDNDSIELQYIAVDLPDFRCSDWYGHMICQAGFKDRYDKTVELYWDKDTGKVYNYKPTLHTIRPDISPKITDWVLVKYMNEQPPTYQIRIAIGVSQGSGENELQLLKQAGMNVTSKVVTCAGLGICVLGRANASVILRITEFAWVREININEAIAHTTDDIDDGIINRSGFIMEVAILSNSVDMPVALKLKTFLENSNIEVKDIYPASSFGNLPTLSYLLILGGPEAYEGIGGVSAEYLTDDEEDYLINSTNAFKYWIKEKYHVVVIAGHTRNETAMAESAFEDKGFEELLTLKGS